MRCLSVYRSFSGQRISQLPHRNVLKMKLRDAIRSLYQELAAPASAWLEQTTNYRTDTHCSSKHRLVGVCRAMRGRRCDRIHGRPHAIPGPPEMWPLAPYAVRGWH